MKRKATGQKDQNGVEIKLGDIVRFYFNAENHWSWNLSKKPKQFYSELVDVVIEEDGMFYLVCDWGTGAYLWRIKDYGEVLGNVFDSPEIAIKAGFTSEGLAHIKKKVKDASN